MATSSRRSLFYPCRRAGGWGAAGQAAAARTFAAVSRAGHLAVADYANTHNPKLISSDGRTTWALINVPKLATGDRSERKR
jgi:hypothetical protein